VIYKGGEIGSQLRGDAYHSGSVIPFVPAAKNQTPPETVDQLDKAGQTILRLLHKAAGVAEANSHHALEMAQKLSHQLRAAEDRIAEVEIYRDKADRAEVWLHKVYTEIETDFCNRITAAANGAPARRQSAKPI
jgi:hypothetical protein